MKLRILRQSIRLRVTQAEVAELGQGRPVSAELTTAAGAAPLIAYQVEPSAEVTTLGLVARPGNLTVQVSRALAEDLARTDRVTIEETIVTGPDHAVSVCLEKDFQCLKPRQGGQDDDTFPHPEAAQDVPR